MKLGLALDESRRMADSSDVHLLGETPTGFGPTEL